MQSINKKITLNCNIHKQSLISALSLDPQNQLKQRLLCTKCLIDLHKKDIKVQQLIDIDDLDQNPKDQILQQTNGELCFDDLFEKFDKDFLQFEQQIGNMLFEIKKATCKMKEIISLLKCSLDDKIDELIQMLRSENAHTTSIEQYLDQLSHDIQIFNMETRIKIYQKLNLEPYQNLNNTESEDEESIFGDSLTKRVQQWYSIYLNSIQSIQIEFDKINTQSTKIIEKISNSPYQKQLQELEDFPKVHKLISNGRQIYYCLLYQGTKDGFDAKSYWQKCNNQTHLLTLIQLQNGYTLGGFSPCQVNINEQNYISDYQMSSFIYSANRQEVYPLKSSNYAIKCKLTNGPTFGAGHDLAILDDFQRVYSNLGHSYDVSKIQHLDENHIIGENPELSECKVYKIIYL